MPKLNPNFDDLKCVTWVRVSYRQYAIVEMWKSSDISIVSTALNDHRIKRVLWKYGSYEEAADELIRLNNLTPLELLYWQLKAREG